MGGAELERQPNVTAFPPSSMAQKSRYFTDSCPSGSRSSRPELRSPFFFSSMPAVEPTLKPAAQTSAPAAAATAAELSACPKCGLPLRHRTGRHGPFIGCSGFPRCRKTLQLPGAKERPRSTPGLSVRIEMESETSVRVWCSQGVPQQAWLRVLLARVLPHVPAIEPEARPRADWVAQRVESTVAARAPAVAYEHGMASTGTASNVILASGERALGAAVAVDDAASDDDDAPEKPDRSLVGPPPKAPGLKAWERASQATRERYYALRGAWEARKAVYDTSLAEPIHFTTAV